MKKFALAAALSVLGAGTSVAADMAVKAPPVAAAPPCIWCGFYMGINAGYVSADNGLSVVSTATPGAAVGVADGVTQGIAALSTRSLPVGRTDGFIGGAQAGYNWASGAFLVGVEADIQGLSNSRTSGTVVNSAVVLAIPVTSTQTGSMSTSYLGTVRGRVGLLATTNWLLYVTGGLAYGEVSASNTLTHTTPNGLSGFGAASTQTRALAGRLAPARSG